MGPQQACWHVPPSVPLILAFPSDAPSGCKQGLLHVVCNIPLGALWAWDTPISSTTDAGGGAGGEQMVTPGLSATKKIPSY